MSLIEKVSKLPRWSILAGGIFIIVILGFLLLRFGFGIEFGGTEKSQAAQNVHISVPDAPEVQNEISATEAYKESLAEEQKGRKRVSDYWDDIIGGNDDSSGNDLRMTSEDDLDPNIYSPSEIKLIRNGFRTKESIDREHAAVAAEQAERERRARAEEASKPKPLTEAQRDSQYFARMERAYQLASKYAGGGVQEETPLPEEEPERKIEIPQDGPSSIPAEAYSEDAIISSLDDSWNQGESTPNSRKYIKPVKATFLKTEKVTTGNRVIIRLMQDLTLSDGTVIPENTHITGICSFNKRLKIHVDMLHYNGKMFPVDISAYDNDGTEGLYCPLAVSQKRKERVAKNAATGAISSIGSIAGTVLTGNPFLGSMATTGLQSVSGVIGDDGTVTVNVTSGYEFYVYENVKDNS